MSRSGYTTDCENLGLYRGTVDRTLAGRRGQAFLRELVQVLVALPDKRLESEVFVSQTGFCAMGAVAVARGLGPEQVDGLDYYDASDVGIVMGISGTMAAEIAFENDDDWSSMTDEVRYEHMLKWARGNIDPDPSPSARGHCGWCCRELTLRPCYRNGERVNVVSWHKYRGTRCTGAGEHPRPLPDSGEHG